MGRGRELEDGTNCHVLILFDQKKELNGVINDLDICEDFYSEVTSQSSDNGIS